MFQELVNFVNYQFIQNALISAILVGLILPFIGSLVITRRMAYIADIIGHTNMAGVTFALLISATTGLAFTKGLIPYLWIIISAVAIEYLRRKYHTNKEVALMIVYALNVALTVVFLNLNKSYNNNITSILFGNVSQITKSEVIITLGLTVVVLLILKKYYKRFLLLALEEEKLTIYGYNYQAYSYGLIIITAVTITLVIKVIGVLLVSALLILPSLSASVFAKSNSQMIKVAMTITILTQIIGIMVSYFYNIAASAIIVLLNIGVFIGFKAIDKLKK